MSPQLHRTLRLAQLEREAGQTTVLMYHAGLLRYALSSSLATSTVISLSSPFLDLMTAFRLPISFMLSSSGFSFHRSSTSVSVRPCSCVSSCVTSLSESRPYSAGESGEMARLRNSSVEGRPSRIPVISRPEDAEASAARELDALARLNSPSSPSIRRAVLVSSASR